MRCKHARIRLVEHWTHLMNRKVREILNLCFFLVVLLDTQSNIPLHFSRNRTVKPSSGMASKQPRLTTWPADEFFDEKPPRQARNSATWSLCLVCGDRANIINYGRLTFQSCKTFFRRNGFNPEVRC
jgi:hypothetical protein